MSYVQAVVNRFLRYAIPGEKPNDCWTWIASQRSFRRGQFYIANKLMLASRVSYTLFRGDIPEGLCILHACDNPECTNPAHLFLGTHRENMADSVAKGRHHHGDLHRSAKLNSIKVREIRSLILSGRSCANIAKDFGMHQRSIVDLKNKKTWRHVV